MQLFSGYNVIFVMIPVISNNMISFIISITLLYNVISIKIYIIFL